MKEKKMKKLTALALGLAVVATAAEAQTYSQAGEVKTYYPTGKQTQLTASINSGTVPNPFPVTPFEALSVGCSSTVITSVTVLVQNDNGQTVSQTTVACGTTAGQVFSTAAGGLGGSAVAVSATAGFTATNSANLYVNKAPAILQRGF